MALRAKDAARVLGIAPGTRPRFGLSGPAWVARALEIRKYSVADALGDDVAWSLDQTLYAIRWYVETGRATTAEDRALAAMNPYRFLVVAVDVTNEAPKGSINDRVAALKARLAR